MGRPAIELDLRLAVGAAGSREVVSVRGEPDVELAIDGGLHGDVTTPAVVVNSVPRVREAATGRDDVRPGDATVRHGLGGGSRIERRQVAWSRPDGRG